MLDEELYTFDLNGFLVVENAIPNSLLKLVNKEVDTYERRAQLTTGSDLNRSTEKPRSGVNGGKQR